MNVDVMGRGVSSFEEGLVGNSQLPRAINNVSRSVQD